MTATQELLQEYLKNPEKYETEIKIILNSIKTENHTEKNVEEENEEIINKIKSFAKGGLEIDSAEVTKNKLSNTNFNRAQRLMARIEEVYGRHHSIHTPGLADELSILLKENKIID
jgi:hypothetical protein